MTATRAGRLAPLVAAAMLSVAVAGCNRTGAPPDPAPSGVAPAPLRLPDGKGCSGEIARYRAIVANDLATGHVGRAVHDRIVGEIDRAASACSAGRDADALRAVSAAKARYGYR